MENTSITAWVKANCLCFVFIAVLAGCQNSEEIQLEASYPYNCSWYGNHELAEGPVSGPPEPRYTGEGIRIPAEFSYGLPLEVNPTNPDQVLVGKGVWDEVAQETRRTIVTIDLQTLQETRVLELDPFDDPQAELWNGFRWGEEGWVVTEKINDKQLYLISPNGGNPQRLTDPALGAFHNPCWVANGKRILSLGDGPNGVDRRWRVLDLLGEVEKEFFLSNLPPSFVRYHQFADWRADSLLVSAEPSFRQSLNIFRYPEMSLVKNIQVIHSESNTPVVSDQEWWPGTERILWQLYGALYATDWQTGETEAIWEDCERLLQGFAVMPSGEQAICLFGEHVVREDLGGTQYSIHLYALELSSGVITRIK
jgi:hypothetical protein